MSPNPYSFKKTRTTFLSLFFSSPIFSNTAAAGFFVKKGAAVKTLERLFVSPSKSTVSSVFYAKEKTVFHRSKSTQYKALYFIRPKKLKENEKGTTCFRSVEPLLKENKRQLKLFGIYDQRDRGIVEAQGFMKYMFNGKEIKYIFEQAGNLAYC